MTIHTEGKRLTATMFSLALVMNYQVLSLNTNQNTPMHSKPEASSDFHVRKNTADDVLSCCASFGENDVWGLAGLRDAFKSTKVVRI